MYVKKKALYISHLDRTDHRSSLPCICIRTSLWDQRRYHHWDKDFHDSRWCSRDNVVRYIQDHRCICHRCIFLFHHKACPRFHIQGCRCPGRIADCAMLVPSSFYLATVQDSDSNNRFAYWNTGPNFCTGLDCNDRDQSRTDNPYNRLDKRTRKHSRDLCIHHRSDTVSRRTRQCRCHNPCWNILVCRNNDNRWRDRCRAHRVDTGPRSRWCSLYSSFLWSHFDNDICNDNMMIEFIIFITSNVVFSVAVV